MMHIFSNKMNLKSPFNFIISALILLGAFQVFTPKIYGGKVYVPKGTEISIKFKMTLSTELKNKPAASEIFEVASNQTISGVEVIQQGAQVYCEIVEFKKPGLLGGGGVIEVRVDSVRTALGQNIRLDTHTLKSKGKNKKLKAFLMLPLLGYGFIIKGEHAQLGSQNETIILETAELKKISY